MRLFHFKPKRFYVDVDHVLMMGELEFQIEPSVIKPDSDGILMPTQCSGHAKFWFQLAFQKEREVFEVRYEKTNNLWNETQQQRSDRMVKDLTEFKGAYDRLFAAWSARDGQPASLNVLT